MKYISIVILFILLSFSSFSADLRAYLDSKQFYAPGKGNYIEFHIQFIGPSLKYVGKDDGLIGEVAIQMSIEQDGKIVQSDAYRLSTPFMKDSIISDFYDIKRFVLPPGEYQFNIELLDLNNNQEALKTSQTIFIEDLSSSISISNIVVAEYANKGDGSSVFFKSGYDIIPRLVTFYPKELSIIPAYFEIYNTNLLPDSIFAIQQTITDALSGEVLQDFTQFTKLNTAEVVPFFKKIDISNLTSGKYILSFTIINKSMMQLSTQSYHFDRSNDFDYSYLAEELMLDPAFQESITDDSIGFYLESLIPISKANEVRNIVKLVKSKNAESARKYIQLYWAKTAPKNTYEAWIKYKTQVLWVQKHFSNSFQKGYETDRGRVYLQYGPPNHINRNVSSSTEYPYEIWQYYRIGVYNNKRFVFYNPEMTNNNYKLIHSDMIGELHNPNWPNELSRRNGSNRNEQFGGNSQDMYNE